MTKKFSRGPNGGCGRSGPLLPRETAETRGAQAALRPTPRAPRLVVGGARASAGVPHHVEAAQPAEQPEINHRSEIQARLHGNRRFGGCGAEAADAARHMLSTANVAHPLIPSILLPRELSVSVARSHAGLRWALLKAHNTKSH